MADGTRQRELSRIVSSVPYGHVASYGAVGRAMSVRVSGLIVGRWMANAPMDVPWWRIVAADGRLVLAKRDPALAVLQRQKLEEEGVQFDGELVSQEHFFPVDLLGPPGDTL